MSVAKTLATVRRLLSGKPAVAVGVQVNMNNEGRASQAADGKLPSLPGAVVTGRSNK